MSIQNEIERINQNISNSYSAVQEMGGNIPEVQNSNNLSDAVKSIPQGTAFTTDDTLTLQDGTLSVSLPTKALTKAEYNALSEEEKMADVEYIITDDNGDGGGTGNGSGVPSGFIGMWHGTEVPDGWALCDGTNGTPDLRGRFVLGESDIHGIGETGGSEEVTLTNSQMPEHTHNIQAYQNAGSNTTFVANGSKAGSGMTTYASLSSGSSKPHPNMPPYYVLAYIMKL